MRVEERNLIAYEVRKSIIPEIKKIIPGVLGWVLRTIFPRLERLIIENIIRIVELILLKRGE